MLYRCPKPKLYSFWRPFHIKQKQRNKFEGKVRVDGATINEEPRRTAATVAETTKVAARRRLLEAEVGTVAMVSYIRFASNLQKGSSAQFKRVQSFGIRKRVECSALEC
jgi:hypothetical protein